MKNVPEVSERKVHGPSSVIRNGDCPEVPGASGSDLLDDWRIIAGRIVIPRRILSRFGVVEVTDIVWARVLINGSLSDRITAGLRNENAVFRVGQIQKKHGPDRKSRMRVLILMRPDSTGRQREEHHGHPAARGLEKG